MTQQNQAQSGPTGDQGISSPAGIKRLYSIREAAHYLNMGEYGVRELIWANELPHIQRVPRGKVLIDVKDLDRFITKHKRYE